MLRRSDLVKERQLGIIIAAVPGPATEADLQAPGLLDRALENGRIEKRRPRDDGSQENSQMCYLYLIFNTVLLAVARRLATHMQTQSARRDD